MVKLITLFLTCADRDEADKLTAALLDKKLVACVRLSDVNSTFLWEGKKENSSEVLLMMESAESKFDDIDTTVRQLHSYKTFVLEALPVLKASSGVEAWIKEELDVAG
jgi:periplasmic divalent cation tolerance protein